MSYTTPTTVTAAELITVQKLNEQWIDNIAFLANPPACKLTKSGTQTISASTRTAVLFDEEAYDTDSMHSTSSNTSRITFNTAGIYLLTGTLEWAADAGSGIRQTEIRTNGSDSQILAVTTSHPGTVATIAMVVATYKATAATYAELTAFQTSDGGTIAAGGTADYQASFTATWIGLG